MVMAIGHVRVGHIEGIPIFGFPRSGMSDLNMDVMQLQRERYDSNDSETKFRKGIGYD